MEVLRDIKSNGLFAFLKILTLGLLLVSVYNISSFSQSADDAIDKSFSSDAGVDMYGITDTFFDPDSFYDFRQSQESLDSLARFYNALNEHPSLNFLSSFNQPMPIANFRGGETFDRGYGTDMEIRGEYRDEQAGVVVRDVKSLQLNQATYDFYNLGVDGGEDLDWNRVDYDSGSIPVLLGSNYRGIYNPGDVIKTNYYSVGMDLVVSGFLAEDSSIFYKGEMNTFLGDYLVIPYPPKLSPVTDENMYFNGILYFAMAAGDIAVDQSKDAGGVMRLIASVSNQTGFKDYTLLNVPSYLTQYQFMKDIIQQNAALLTALGALLATGVVLINGSLSRHQVRRRSQQYSIRWLQGQSSKSISLLNSGLTFLEYAVLAVSVTVAVSFLPNGLTNGNSGSFFTTMAGLAIALVLDLVYQNHRVAHHLNDQSGKEGHIL